MITFKPVMHNIYSDGYTAVYIRVTKDKQSDYTKTNYIAKEQQLSDAKLKNFLLITKNSVKYTGQTHKKIGGVVKSMLF